MWEGPIKKLTLIPDSIIVKNKTDIVVKDAEQTDKRTVELTIMC
jgi:hypothetical protein